MNSCHWAFAGTRVLTGEARVRIVYTGGETLYGEIVRSATRGTHARTPLQSAVANLVAVSHENNMLERERDMWKARAEGTPAAVKISDILPALTAAEVGAIRKAMARLHHPDTGGDSERLKAWNAALDALEP